MLMRINKAEHALSLQNGDRMTQAEFHVRYEAYPKDVKIELIGGTVFMASPTRWSHGAYLLKLGAMMDRYSEATPGIDCAIDATAILSEESEPRPDLALRVLAEYGGQSQVNDEKYLVGAPELVAEIAFSTYSIDMHLKREDYEKAGVAEYLVVCLEERELHWFNFRTGSEIRATRDGVWRSQVFPGFWIDGAALLDCASKKLNATLQHGIASPAHVAFVRKLERVHRKHSKQ